MSPQDTQLLENFLNQLVQARGLPKDPEAEAMIQKAVAYQPDAAYLLVQRALLQQQALDNAKAEIANLQRQLQGGAPNAGGFLDPNAWGNSGGQRQPAQAYGSQVQQQYPQHDQQPSLASRASNFFRGGMGGGGMGGGGMGGALGNIASTAAGVAAGAFLFQGLGNLLGHHNQDGNGFLGNNDAFSSLTSPIEDFQNSGGDSAGNLLGDSNTDSSSLLDDAGVDADSFAGDTFDGGSDDSSFS